MMSRIRAALRRIKNPRAEAEAAAEREAEVERLKREAARRTSPTLVRKLALAKLTKLEGT